ncbi:BatA domain-containing protein [Stenotrophomonas sp.]|uniref:BatA domain-containing protein n=1 Tax=Stenotrophomonas sp. TaxID=69392 RepID=UPI0028A03747|nr:BatA domain-containing protein [Stenotrophomonas sp.]
MSLSLLFPLGLLALAALVVPLLIHLARRHHYAPLDFAALRWLRARAQPRQRIRFDEWPLLLVRLLLLTALALLLAHPLLHGAATPTAPWVVVTPGLTPPSVDEGSEGRWLAPGFPSLEQPAPTGPQPLASLLRELDQAMPAGAALTVYVPDPMPGLDGERARLSRRVEWRSVRHPLPAPAAAAVAPQLRVAGAATDAQTQRALEALQRAWSQQPLPASLAGDEVPATGQVGVWLGDAALPASWQTWVQNGGSVLVTSTAAAPGTGVAVLRDATGAVAVSRHRLGSGQVLRFSKALSPATLPILREPDFPRQLLEQLQPIPAPRVASAATQQPLIGATSPAAQPQDLSIWLLPLVVLLFALERWMATSARRGRPA